MFFYKWCKIIDTVIDDGITWFFTAMFLNLTFGPGLSGGATCSRSCACVTSVASIGICCKSYAS